MSSIGSDLASLVLEVFVCASLFSCLCLCRVFVSSHCADGIPRPDGSVVVSSVAESINLQTFMCGMVMGCHQEKLGAASGINNRITLKPHSVI